MSKLPGVTPDHALSTIWHHLVQVTAKSVVDVLYWSSFDLKPVGLEEKEGIEDQPS